MTNHLELGTWTVRDLSQRCAQESDHFFNRQPYDPRFCFELFRRAILHQNERAWDSVYHQYQPLVASWVERHSMFPAANEEVQYFLNRAFEKMWRVLTPEKFADFPDLKSLLRYLQMCVHSVIVDAVRRQEQAQRLDDVPESAVRDGGGQPVEERVLGRVQREELWAFLLERLKDEKEEKVVYGSFVLGLKPGQLYDEFEGTFADVNEIYRVKENVMARFRRDQDLPDFLDSWSRHWTTATLLSKDAYSVQATNGSLSN
ncbi:MAG TPA: sigma-70 family RNA polymerase sigma factor [Anaerolineae bacterium]